MGGDHGPVVTLEACHLFLAHQPDAHLLLVGQPDRLTFQHPRASIVPALEVVEMHDPLEVALRRKKDSSMRVSVELVKSGQAQAAVSAGNTGALMAISRYVLKTLDGIDRPAIAGQFPNARGGGTTMLDMGANVDCTPAHLLQFAVMGSALVSVLQGTASPTVGLLNIGEEDIKGGENIKKTGDLVVCDGFVGNVALKAIEGLAGMMSGFLRESFSASIFTKIAGIFSYSILSAFKDKMDHRRYNGAALLGLRGLVFKSHGSADAIAFENALRRAYDAARNDLTRQVQERIAHAAPLLNAFAASSSKDLA